MIIPDLPGCGETPAGEPPFTVSRHAEFLQAFLDRLGIGEHDVGGICLGATVALDEFTEWKTIYVDYSGRLQRAQIDTGE